MLLLSSNNWPREISWHRVSSQPIWFHLTLNGLQPQSSFWSKDKGFQWFAHHRFKDMQKMLSSLIAIHTKVSAVFAVTQCLTKNHMISTVNISFLLISRWEAEHSELLRWLCGRERNGNAALSSYVPVAGGFLLEITPCQGEILNLKS